MKLVVVFLTLTCVLVLYLIKLNNGQRKELLIYQYKTLQRPLADVVRVEALKSSYITAAA
ncbi:ORF47 [Betabaculovirus altermyunipunctae]|uniref:ORF47 n=1 Tax=Betabaculovirus altermyunipunctae TaxID=3051996 RepID=A0A1S5YE92_9BBAC|nr:ORF47 [Betabaculovirus altermyunipunctae]AQQ80314.1 ORF47 [Betabaculovirus altermyunipunctae]